MTNPLSDYFRKPEVIVTLPAGKWYNEGEIDFSATGDVPVYSMLPADEIMMINPDALVSGVAITEVIKSCCPAVKNPGNLYYPDVNAIMLANHRATYGGKIEQQAFCPKCHEKRIEVIAKRIDEIIIEKKLNINELSEEQGAELREQAEKDTTDIISEMEKKGEINLNPITYEANYDDLIALQTQLPDEKVVEANGLKVYVSPYRCSDKIKFVNLEIMQNRIIKEYTKFKKNDERFENGDVNLIENTLLQYKDLSEESIKILSGAVLKVLTPNGMEIVDNNYIQEFLLNSDINVLNKIKQAVIELTGMGIPQTLPFECPVCGHHFEEKFDRYNQADFFGRGS